MKNDTDAKLPSLILAWSESVIKCPDLRPQIAMHRERRDFRDQIATNENVVDPAHRFIFNCVMYMLNCDKLCM